MNKEIYEAYVRIIEKELVPALGCTEPIAIALAGAKARETLGEFPDSMEIRCSGNIIKNVMGVTVPNSGGLKGVNIALALGAVGGDTDGGLEVLSKVTEEHRKKAKKQVENGFVTCKLEEGVDNLFLVATARGKKHYSEVTIIKRHTFISKIVRDGEVLFDANMNSNTENNTDKEYLNVKDIIEFANTVEMVDIKDIISRQISMNTEISDFGLKNEVGARVGHVLISASPEDVKTRAKARAASGSDARMSGCAMPVVINSGSGNQGMTVSLPVIEYAQYLMVSEEKLYRALVLSNLLSVHQKKQIGNLSAFCGAVTAACGAGAAITYLYDGDYEKICNTITNTIANVGGIICDGAKPSCAAKIASAVDAAIMAHEISMAGYVFGDGEGLVQNNIEATIKSVGYVGRVGMRSTDIEILNIMIDKVKL